MPANPQLPLHPEKEEIQPRTNGNISQLINLPAISLHLHSAFFCRTTHIGHRLFHRLTPFLHPGGCTFLLLKQSWTSMWMPLLFLALFFFLCFQCKLYTVTAQLIISIGHFNAYCLIAFFHRRKDGCSCSGKGI